MFLSRFRKFFKHGATFTCVRIHSTYNLNTDPDPVPTASDQDPGFSGPWLKYTVPKKIDFPRYNMKSRGDMIPILHETFHVVSRFPRFSYITWYNIYNMKCTSSGENAILHGIFHVVSCFPLHFMLFRGNLDYSSDSVWPYRENKTKECY